MAGIECIVTEIIISKIKWLLVGFYNPDKSTIVSNIAILERNISHYLCQYDNVIILGDFNSELKEDAMNTFSSTFSLKSLINSPTCFKNSENPSCIDLILTNKPRSFQNSAALEIGLSDFHLLTVTVLKTTFKKKPARMIKYRDYKNYSQFKFKNDLCEKLTEVDLNMISNDDFNTILMNLVNTHAPLKTKYLRGNDQPFMNKKLRKEHMKRTMLKNRYLKDKSDFNFMAFKKQRNYCVKLLRDAKKVHFESLKPSDVNDNKRFWQTVKPLFSDKVISSDNITLVENDTIISDPVILAETFGNFFSNAVKNLNIDMHKEIYSNCHRSNQKNDTDTIFKIIRKYENHPSILKIKESFPDKTEFSFQTICSDLVLKEIENLSEKKSSPLESVPTKIIKDHRQIISFKIKIDFNDAISKGIFPDNMKLADISPIFKKKDKHSKNNYRPVSILPAMSKIFERLMLSQINEYMSDKLSIFLCGFRKGMNSQNCLLFLVEKLKRSLDRSDKSGILLTDLSKAFDCLVHDLLIAKLHAYGFDHLSLKLMHSYLTDRFQRVRINSTFSSWFEIFTGVPQGSILGPNLYNINSNDLFLMVLLDLCNFADDNSPFAVAPKMPRVLEKLENEAKSLLDWIKNNGLKANPDKFHLILSDKDLGHSIQVDGSIIKNCANAKLLGIKFDNKLTFKLHVEELCTKASKKLHALARVSNYMTLKQRKLIMYSFISSHFGYCPLVWMFHSRILNNKINRIHERALRIVYKDNVSSFEDLLLIDNSFTVHERNIQTLAIELYKVVNRLSPKIMDFVFPLKKVIRYPNENIFKTTNIKTVAWGTESLGYLGPKIWNIIPDNLKSLKSLPLFIKNIRTWKPFNCPCRICKLYITGLGFIEKQKT